MGLNDRPDTVSTLMNQQIHCQVSNKVSEGVVLCSCFMPLYFSAAHSYVWLFPVSCLILVWIWCLLYIKDVPYIDHACVWNEDLFKPGPISARFWQVLGTLWNEWRGSILTASREVCLEKLPKRKRSGSLTGGLRGKWQNGVIVLRCQIRLSAKLVQVQASRFLLRWFFLSTLMYSWT